MASSPGTPRHSRHPSSITFDYNENYSQGSSPIQRIQSRSSFQEPSTPLNNNLDMNIFSSGGGAAPDNGLGNLADELAGFDEEEDGYEEGYYDEETGAVPGTSLAEDLGVVQPVEGTRDSGIEVDSPSRRGKALNLNLPSPGARGHKRQGSTASAYDGTEYGSDSDLDSPGMSASLVAKLDAVDSLVRRGTESNGSAADGAVKRVIEGLRDLGSQAGVEGGASRLITAHSALATHMAHQTRQIHNLTFPILSPLVPPPDPDTIDELLPLLVDLSDALPTPSTSAYTSLAALHTITNDLVQTLNYLSDTLHMSRQTTTTATRRLKSARELVADLKKEEELREEGELWLSRGNWGERLQRRECAHVCGEVVGGFEEVCNNWRARLLASAGEVPA